MQSIRFLARRTMRLCSSSALLTTHHHRFPSDPPVRFKYSSASGGVKGIKGRQFKTPTNDDADEATEEFDINIDDRF